MGIHFKSVMLKYVLGVFQLNLAIEILEELSAKNL